MNHQQTNSPRVAVSLILFSLLAGVLAHEWIWKLTLLPAGAAALNSDLPNFSQATSYHKVLRQLLRERSWKEWNLMDHQLRKKLGKSLFKAAAPAGRSVNFQ